MQQESGQMVGQREQLLSHLRILGAVGSETELDREPAHYLKRPLLNQSRLRQSRRVRRRDRRLAARHAQRGVGYVPFVLQHAIDHANSNDNVCKTKGNSNAKSERHDGIRTRLKMPKAVGKISEDNHRIQNLIQGEVTNNFRAPQNSIGIRLLLDCLRTQHLERTRFCSAEGVAKCS
ncbi:hypothetical protein KOR42_55520 [Thalassoglobus neptunius]|uniref:Uncharacterized protein n=1 Tax=Thalassoglobus neptunius TaxID=1938619 RepID=A0A5C5US19_9PLAN|nr:hypothetical protein KOR42_55520 [Thalassoglobus neptunius]